MPAESPACEVLVVGGGPAAVTTARLLGIWGRDVVLVTRPEPTEPDAELPESLTPSCQKFFDLMGISSAIAAAGFREAGGHTVWWGGTERIEPFEPPHAGWHVTTGQLNRALMGTLASAGVRVVRRTVTADEVLAWPARFRVDASGRAGVLARPLGERRYEPGHRTVALVGTWQRADAWPLPHPSHTLLESYADGWAWSVPIDATTRAVAVMVDPKTTVLARGDGATAVYKGEVLKTENLASIVDGATLLGGPAGWDASLYLADRLTGDDWLLAGDAGSAVDPLSSAGAKKAMASGWLAAVTLNTALTYPERQRLAFDYFASRERLTYQRFLAMTRRFLGEGAPSRDHPFWSDRAGEPVADDREDVLRAYDRLRTADVLRLTIAPDVRFEDRPALREREIVFERQLVTPLVPEGVRYIDGVDVVRLVHLAPECQQVPDLFAAYVREAGETDLREFLKALATTVARRWLMDT